jgi:hypothetical protein
MTQPPDPDADPVVLEPPGRLPPEVDSAPSPHRAMGRRLFYVVLLWVMLSLAATVLTAVTVIQGVIMLASRGEPNHRLAEFGEGLGIWIAKAARFQAAASETKPWPWTDID